MVFAAPTAIHNEPLAQALSGVKPNIMFILDDSGSMESPYLPDYVVSSNCRRSATVGSTPLSSSLTGCVFGDVPYNSAEFNRQYYNPEIYYPPSPAPGGVTNAARNMNAANTNNWTQVRTDIFNKQNLDSLDNTATYVNLVTGYPDRVWCADPSDAITSCRSSADHTYPNEPYKYGVDAGNNVRYKYGAPYYYKVSTPQYCTDNKLTSCQATQDATHTVQAPVRFCTNNTLSNCQSKRISPYVYPYFAGQLVGATAGTRASATITVGNSGSDNSVSVSSIMAGTTELIGTTITASGGTNSGSERNTVANSIATAINSRTGITGYSATVNNAVVTVRAPLGAVYNGVAIQPATTGGGARATALITVTVGTSTNNSNRQITNITVGGITIWGSFTYTATASQSVAAATDIANRINTYTNTNPWEYTATSSGNVVTVYAPINVGARPNNLALAVTRGSAITISTTSMGGGSGALDVPLTTTAFSGGADVATGTWTSDIHFERVDIVPTSGGLAKTFPRGVNRDDCVTSATYCTYEEEMTNFANWYTHYRTRMQSAKSAAGRAFSGITDSMRVGFITINPMSGSSVVSSRYLKINDFAYNSVANTGHKKDWYDKLYGTGFNGATPLREALARVGRLYAGKTDGINSGFTASDSPIQYACQPNFSILTTDGYWNGNNGVNLTSNGISNEDNVDSGYSKRIDGAYDGALTGATSTLSDVAMYYYKTDLRTDLADTVFTTSKDTAPHQHMTTFTVSIGLSGILDYDRSYESKNSGDFYAIKQGTLDWPVPAANSETALDDLWHAAVNGRGTFYSAANPEDFNNGLTDALTQMFARAGAGSAAATSNLQPTQADNFAFTAEYETQSWRGNLIARTIDTVTGEVSTASLWSAASLLDANNYMNRNIYTFDSSDTTATSTAGTGNKLKSFCMPSASWATCSDGSGLTTTEQGYFNPNQLGQYPGWGLLQRAGASASNLVSYIRGDRSNETTGGSSGNDLYRERASTLGDIINAQPAYLKGSPYNYDNTNNPFYSQYKSAVTTRRGTVFAASNDGMLHAFETDVNNSPYYQTQGISTISTSDDVFVGNNAGNGEERWAYIPGILLPSIHKLAETPYTHRYFVDGSPVIGDVCSGHTASTPCTSVNNWKSILVAGLNSGGRGYYALDVTDPVNPKALWELTSSTTCLTDAQVATGSYSSDCNVGLSYGNPLIAKRPSDDRWVVIVTSGYNNYNPGDGKGYLYILDAITGKILQRMSTGVGSSGTAAASYSDASPSGLGRINGWATNAIENNVVLAVYGGDLQGNLWRFDLDPTSSNYNTVFKLATLKDSVGNVQPITIKPELGLVAPFRIVLVGTGKYLGTTDPADLSQQTLYAIRDDASTTTVLVRNDLLQRLFATTSGTTRSTQSGIAMDWLSYKGWYIDLPDSGERVNVDPQLQLGTLIFASNVPSTDICSAGGYAWINSLDYKQGLQVTGNVASNKSSSAMVVGFSTIKLAGGTVKTIATTADNRRTTFTPAVTTGLVSGKRVSWRELINE